MLHLHCRRAVRPTLCAEKAAGRVLQRAGLTCIACRLILEVQQSQQQAADIEMPQVSLGECVVVTATTGFLMSRRPRKPIKSAVSF
jgi:hypothetical protein